VTKLLGADQPFGTTKRVSYRMTADRYVGRVLYVTFRTETNLSAWLPPPLEMNDVHAGFLKIYDLKRRPEHGPPYPPGYSQYHEACVTVMAAPPGQPARHYNLFMWVTHDWAMYKARAALGWPKKLANIAMTRTFPSDTRYDRDEASNQFNVDVDRYGYPIINIRAELDSAAPPQTNPPFNGFYSVRHIPAPQNASDDIRELLVIETRDGWVGESTYGNAEVRFGDAPDEELAALGRVQVTGCALRDTGWVLPAWPARRLLTLDPFDVDMGEPRPT
jgi:hypothetical protein